MDLRADHVAGAAFVAFGVLIIALSGDLPVGQLSMPGAGFLPKIIAVLLIIFGLTLFARGKESGAYSELGWSDAPHAAQVIAIIVAATALYTTLGFILTMTLMVLGLLVIIERRHPLRAVVYSVSIVVLTYAAFHYFLKAPLPEGPFGY